MKYFKGLSKLLSVIVLLVFVIMPVLSQAASTTATMGDTNASNVYRFSCDTDGVCAYAQDTGILMPYVSYTTSPGTVGVTLTAAQTGAMIVDTGGFPPTGTGSCRKFTLPTAAPGMLFSFSTGSKCTMTVDVQSADQILYSISGTGLDAGDSIKSTGQAGDAVTLFSPAAGTWAVKDMKAVWTDNGTS